MNIIKATHKENKLDVYIDKEDFNLLSQYSWYITSNGYVATNIKRKRIYMHRLIMNATEGNIIDHTNHNKLDNRKNNLRLCTKSDNNRNRKHYIYQNKSSKYKGVSFCKREKRWYASIHINNIKKHIGIFDNEKDAALAYNDFAIKFFGEFALLNKCE